MDIEKIKKSLETAISTQDWSIVELALAFFDSKIEVVEAETTSKPITKSRKFTPTNAPQFITEPSTAKEKKEAKKLYQRPPVKRRPKSKNRVVCKECGTKFVPSPDVAENPVCNNCLVQKRKLI